MADEEQDETQGEKIDKKEIIKDVAVDREPTVKAFLFMCYMYFLLYSNSFVNSMHLFINMRPRHKSQR